MWHPCVWASWSYKLASVVDASAYLQNKCQSVLIKSVLQAITQKNMQGWQIYTKQIDTKWVVFGVKYVPNLACLFMYPKEYCEMGDFIEMKPSLNTKDEFKITHFFFPLAGYRMCRWTTSLAQNRSLFNINSITWKIWLTLSSLWSKGGNRGNKLTERVATLPVKSHNI